MTIKEFITNNFGGNVAMFCRAFKISRPTAYDIINKGFQRDTALRRKLQKQGVKF